MARNLQETLKKVNLRSSSELLSACSVGTCREVANARRAVENRINIESFRSWLLYTTFISLPWALPTRLEYDEFDPQCCLQVDRCLSPDMSRCKYTTWHLHIDCPEEAESAHLADKILHSRSSQTANQHRIYQKGDVAQGILAYGTQSLLFPTGAAVFIRARPLLKQIVPSSTSQVKMISSHPSLSFLPVFQIFVVSFCPGFTGLANRA